MFTFFFRPGPVTRLGIGQGRDTARFGRFFRAMLERGVYLAPSQFEAAFVSAAHTDEDIAKTIAAARDAFASLKSIALFWQPHTPRATGWTKPCLARKITGGRG